MARYPDFIGKALSMTDRNGDKPEIVIVVSNRGGGKTYPASRVMMDEIFLQNRRKFALLCRTKNELCGVAEPIFKPYLRDHLPGCSVVEKLDRCRCFSRIFLVDKEGKSDLCGYTLALNGVEGVKKASGEFIEVDMMFMDEFQGSRYLPDEVGKLIDIHMSVTRGDSDEMVRFVPVLLCSNALSIANPYFSALSITSKIQANTNVYRGDGVVLLRFVNREVAVAQETSPFNRAFKKHPRMVSNIDNTWLNDDYTCVGKPKDAGRTMYMCTVVAGDKRFGVRGYSKDDCYSISRSVDETSKLVFGLGESGENLPVIMTSATFQTLKRALLLGKLWFSDLECKRMFVEYLL